MVLILDNKRQQVSPRSIKSFFKTSPVYQGIANQFLSKGTKEIGPKGLLYVGQCEFAVTVSQDKNVSILGSDDATTCIISILRHSASGATALVHFDGTDMKEVITVMIKEIQELSIGHPEGIIELYLVGGYSDELLFSEQIFYDAMNIFQSHSDDIKLTLACVGDMNTELRNGVSWPITYGAGINLKTGEVFPATFSDRGPDEELRHAHLYSSRKFVEIYDCKRGLFKIDPFTYRSNCDLNFMLAQDDKDLLNISSTSPLVEPPHYVNQTRRTLKFMKENPNPLSTVFLNGKGRYFKRNDDYSAWIPTAI